MVREVTYVEQYGTNNSGNIRRYTIASDATIAIGTILKLASPRTASASTGTSDLFAGIASEAHNGTDYSTSISTWTDGIYEFTASGAITAGDKVATAAPGNYVMSLAANTSSHAIVIGYALKSVATNVRVQVRVNI